jgi:hypothetical protein
MLGRQIAFEAARPSPHDRRTRVERGNVSGANQASCVHGGRFEAHRTNAWSNSVMNIVLPLNTARLGFVCAALWCFAPSVDAKVDVLVAERLLAKSGTLAQIDALPVQFKSNFEEGLREQKDVPLTREEINRMSAVVDRTFAVAKLRAAIASGVAETITDEHATALDAWYDSPTGKRMLALEEAAAKSDQAATIQEGTASLAILAPERLARVRELLDATRASDFVAELSIDMSVGATYAALKATARNAPPPIEALRESAAKDKAQIVKLVSESLLAVYVKTYAKASDADLIAYTEFMKSAAGKAFSSAVIGAFSKALVSSANDLSKALVETTKPAKK